MRAWLVASFVLLACGCGEKDPCEGNARLCITASVSGDHVTSLDQLRVIVDELAPQVATSPTPPRAFDLPVKLAIVLPDALAGQSIHLHIDGMAAGMLRAQSDTQEVVLASRHLTRAFTVLGLNVVGDDLGVGDLAGADLSGSDMAGAVADLSMSDMAGMAGCVPDIGTCDPCVTPATDPLNACGPATATCIPFDDKARGVPNPLPPLP
jgi:hypothetical protein